MPLLWLVLSAFALRALIPAGFMPATDGTLSLMLCDDGLPAWLMPHGHGMPAGAGHHSGEDHCLFCSSSTPAPAPLLMALACAVWVAIAVVAAATFSCAYVRLTRGSQARAPPAAV